MSVWEETRKKIISMEENTLKKEKEEWEVDIHVLWNSVF